MKKILLIPMLIALPLTSFATTWQETLEQNFDLAESFDDVQDWGRGIVSDYPNGYKRTNLLPVKADGRNSIISAWSYASSDKSPMIDNAIADHGETNNWRGEGKSIKLGYDWRNDGVHRIDIQTHNGYNNGYSNLHLFYLMKLPNGLLPKSNMGEYYYFSAMKHAYVMQGWNNVSQFGPAGFSSNCAVNVGGYYGLNWSMTNFYSAPFDGLKKKVKLATGLYSPTPTCSGYVGKNIEASSLNNAIPVNISSGGNWAGWNFDIGSKEKNSEWVAIEYNFKTSTPDVPNGKIEFWIYGTDGTILYNGSVNNIVTTATCGCNGTTYFDDEMNKYNQIAIGSNRLKGYGPYTTCTSGKLCTEMEEGYQEFADDSVTKHIFYVDDILIDDAQIGPKYFALLSGNQLPPQPAPVKYNLSHFTNLFSNWLKAISGQVSDLNSDGNINSKDLGIIMSNWE